ncbi:hypothetical protein AKL17_1329 [Frigidibacter mobilis]|uniref:Uncharacterized protein n=1 Tax=Frigidibacter mobilis TaxID=1335048 RepID=A0A159Z0Z8_9RHOB|nr:hypothetical protein AKL17_1329 [Frigidibacter mobilis]
MQAPYGTYTDTIHTICGPGPGRCEAAPLHEARQTSGRAGHRAEHPNGARLLPVQGQRAAPPRLGSGRQGRYRPLSRAAGSFESCRQPLSRPSGTVAYRAGACAPATWFGHLVRVAPAGRGAASGIRAMPGASAAGSAARRPHRGDAACRKGWPVIPCSVAEREARWSSHADRVSAPPRPRRSRRGGSVLSRDNAPARGAPGIGRHHEA